MERCIFRLATEEDYTQINDLLLGLHNYHVKLRPDNYKPVDIFYTKNEYKKRLKKQKFFVAEKNKILIGVIILSFNTNDFSQNCPIINAFFVEENYRGQKIGTMLFNELKNYIDSLDDSYSKSINLTVDSLNKNSIEFYKHLGFDFRYFGMST